MPPISAICCWRVCASSRTIPTCWPIIAPLPLHAGRRISGHQCRPVSVAEPPGRRATAISAWSAMTISRSMAGAARKWKTSCALRATFPAPRSSGWNAITARRRHILGAASGLIAPTKAGWARLCGPKATRARKFACAAWDAEEEARNVADDIEKLHRQGQTLDDMAVLVRASFQMREFEDRFISLGLPYRVIGGPRFYERAGNPRCHCLFRGDAHRQRSGVRAHRQHAPSAASAMPRSSAARFAAPGRVAARGGAEIARPTNCRPRRARRWGAARGVRPLARARPAPYRAGRDGAG